MCDLKILEKAAHFPNIEQAKKINQLILEFLED